MKRREPETPLQQVLSRHHHAVRRVLVMRHALRGAAIVCAVVSFAVLVGVAFQAGPGFAWTRLVLTAACALVAMPMLDVSTLSPKIEALRGPDEPGPAQAVAIAASDTAASAAPRRFCLVMTLPPKFVQPLA